MSILDFEGLGLLKVLSFGECGMKVCYTEEQYLQIMMVLSVSLQLQIFDTAILKYLNLMEDKC